MFECICGNCLLKVIEPAIEIGPRWVEDRYFCFVCERMFIVDGQDENGKVILRTD